MSKGEAFDLVTLESYTSHFKAMYRHIKRKNARIAELEAQLDAATNRLNAKSECIVELEVQLRAAQAEINRLRELVYMAHDTDCTCEICITTPHEPIICCICGQPIEGDDLDSRFWLHKKDCEFDKTGACTCDLECHDTCYDGHEHEYAPLYGDEEDEELP